MCKLSEYSGQLEDEELNHIRDLYSKACRGLNSERAKLIDDLAEGLVYDFEEYSLNASDHGFDYDWRDSIEYDYDFYELWKQGVRERKTVEIKYDSDSSGETVRLVDPYLSRAPYVEGYCHLRGETRKFRMDRMMEIRLTDRTFVKKKKDQS